ncbi:MAG TPA: cell division protein SepF [Pseudonocardiaceae bacterium]|nr:cell division protein SepF [Pseudonocardiaceae bacterium]
MSALHKLKAYFGMVPAEELDDYDTNYGDTNYGDTNYGDQDYRDQDYRDQHRRDQHRRDDYRSGYDRGYQAGSHAKGPLETREHADPAAGPGRHPRRPGADGYRDGAAEPSAPSSSRVHPPRRPSWAPEAPVRGSLAIDPAAPAREPLASPRSAMFAEDEAHPLARIVTLHPHTYNEARPIGERYREGTPVIINLTGMDDKDAKRLVDFAAGLAFALRGSIDKVTNKVFLLSPPNVEVSAEDRRRLAEGGIFNQR